MASESKKGGSVKSNAAAIQSRGRRGMVVSLLFRLLLLLMVMLCSCSCSCSCSEQTQSAKAAVKMHLPKGGRNFNTCKAKAVRLARTFSFDHPQREL